MNRYTDPNAFHTDPPVLDPSHTMIRSMMSATRIVDFTGDIDMLMITAKEAHRNGDRQRMEDMLTLARTGVLDIIASGELSQRMCIDYATEVLRAESMLRDEGIGVSDPA